MLPLGPQPGTADSLMVWFCFLQHEENSWLYIFHWKRCKNVPEVSLNFLEERNIGVEPFHMVLLFGEILIKCRSLL